MSWAEKFPPPVGPMPEQPTETPPATGPASDAWFREAKKFTEWMSAFRLAIVASSLDELIAKPESDQTPADRIAAILGSAYLGDNVQP